MTVVIKVNDNNMKVSCSTRDYETIRSFIINWADEQCYSKNIVLISEYAQNIADNVKRRVNEPLNTNIASEGLPPRSSNEYLFPMRDLGYNPNQQASFLNAALKCEFPALNIIVN